MTYLMPLEELETSWEKAQVIEHPHPFIRGVGGPELVTFAGSFSWRSINVHPRVQKRSEGAPGSCPHAMLLEFCAQFSGLRLSTFCNSCHFCGIAYPKDEIAARGITPVRFTACELLNQRLAGQLENLSLVWTEEDESLWARDWEGFCLTEPKAKRVREAEWRLETYRAVCLSLQSRLYEEYRIDELPDKECWPRERLVGLVKNLHRSLLTNIFDQSGSLICPNAPAL